MNAVLTTLVQRHHIVEERHDVKATAVKRSYDIVCQLGNGKHVVLFHLSKYSDKRYANIFYKMQTEMSNFIQVPVSLVFAATSKL